MASDPSIYAQLGQGVTPIQNPADVMSRYLQLANGAISLQNGQAQLAARQGLADAYRAVPVDPTTGMPNQAELLKNIQTDPRTAWMAPQIIQGIQEQQQRQYGLNKAQLDQTTARTNEVNNALNPLLRLGANVTPQDVFGAVAGLHAAGMPTDEFVQDMATTLPVRAPGQSAASYGQDLQSWIVNHASRTWDPATAASNFKPSINTVDNGGQIITRDTNPYTNPGISLAPPITRQLSPGDQAAQVKGPLGANGQPTVVPQAGYAAQNGMGYLVPGGSNGGGQPSPMGNGRFPTALLNPNRPGAPQPGSVGAGSPGYAPAMPPQQGSGPAAPAPAGMQPPYTPASTQPSYPPPQGYPSAPGPVPTGPQNAVPMATGLGPAQDAALTAQGTASAGQLAALQQSVGGSAGRIYQLKSALGDLQSLGQTGTGPSAGTVNNVKSYLQSLPLVGQSLGIDPNNVANYDLANKYLTAYAAARAGAHGGTTDSQLATTLSSNASTHISNLAAQDVVKANLGLERMDQAQIASFQQGLDPVTGQPTGVKPTPDQFSNFSTQWNTAQDPRAFIADQLSPQQFNATVSAMQPAERARFQSTFNAALSNGWIDPPAWMQGGTAQSNPRATTAPSPPGPAATPQPSPASAPATAPAAQQQLPLPYSLNGLGTPAIAGGY